MLITTTSPHLVSTAEPAAVEPASGPSVKAKVTFMNRGRPRWRKAAVNSGDDPGRTSRPCIAATRTLGRSLRMRSAAAVNPFSTRKLP